MRYKLVINGTLPGLNAYIDASRRNKYQAAGMKRACERAIRSAAMAQLGRVRIQEPVWMHYTWVEQSRRRDKDNIAFARKFVQDALVSAGILSGDGWRQIEGFDDHFGVDAAHPRVEVEIEEA